MYIPSRKKESQLEYRKRLQRQRIERVAFLKSAEHVDASEVGDLEELIVFWDFVIKENERGVIM